MLQIPIRQLDIEPGHVSEWRLGSAAVAPEGAETRRRGASFNQDKHFTAAVEARKDADPLASWVATTFELPGALDHAALESALLYFVRRHEVLRCEFAGLTGDVSCAAMPADELTITRDDIGYVATTAGLRNFIHEFFVTGIDTLRWPLIVMGSVERPEYTTMFVAYDHLVCDGMSSPIAVNDITAAYTAYAEGREPDLPEAGSYVDFGHVQRHRYTSIEADDPRLGYWRDFTERNDGFFPRYPLDLGLEPGEMYETVNDTDALLTAEETAALSDRSVSAGGRLSMAVLAATGVALREAGGPDVYRGLMPVSERGQGDWRHSMGWFVNTMPIEFSVPAGKEFAELVKGVDVALQDMLAGAEVPFVKAWQVLAPELASLRSWPYAVNFFSYLDFRKALGGEQLPRWNAKKHIWASRSNGICHWFHRNSDGLFVNSIYADTPRAHETKATFKDLVVETLHDMAKGRMS
ncbi:condensation domain-containing protein [Saccharomonospora sp. NPDC006951]